MKNLMIKMFNIDQLISRLERYCLKNQQLLHLRKFTCFVVGWQTFLSKVEHFFSETSLVWTLGIKEQNRLGFC